MIDGSGGFSIEVNGVYLSESFVDDSVINLGSDWGPDIELTFMVTSGESGAFAVGAVVPESSTWAMMLVGFAGLASAGYRRARAGRAP